MTLRQGLPVSGRRRPATPSVRSPEAARSRADSDGLTLRSTSVRGIQGPGSSRATAARKVIPRSTPTRRLPPSSGEECPPVFHFRRSTQISHPKAHAMAHILRRTGQVPRRTKGLTPGRGLAPQQNRTRRQPGGWLPGWRARASREPPAGAFCRSGSSVPACRRSPRFRR